MAWRDDYRPGAFRGVPFHLKSSTGTGGRRTVLNEYPLRDEPSTEDMGRRARKFQLSMTVIGPDYMAQRDRLIEALETFGPGTLMHPFRGELLVAVFDDYSCEESTEQGGLARISATFVEAGALPRPDNLAVQGFVGNEAADALEADALSEFLDKFEVVGWASEVAEEAQAMLGDAMTMVGDAVGYAEGLAGDAIGFAQDAAGQIMSGGGLLQGAGSFGTLFRRLTSSVQQLILSPGNLGGSLLGLVRSLSRGTGNPLQALMAQMSLFSIGGKARRVSSPSSSGYVHPARQQIATNQAAVFTLIERVAVAEAVRLAVSKPRSNTSATPVSGGVGNSPSSAPTATSPSNPASATAVATSILASAPLQRVPGASFDNRDQAVEIRDQVLEELDRQQLTATPQRYRQLAQISAALVSEMNLRAASLAPLTRVTPTTTMPALLLAHRLYGDARQAEQIVARNRLTHPGFVPGGVELEVLKNA